MKPNGSNKNKQHQGIVKKSLITKKKKVSQLLVIDEFGKWIGKRS